jgi:hypothetical protein
MLAKIGNRWSFPATRIAKLRLALVSPWKAMRIAMLV